ncbi:DEAD/DEAH box helicase [Globicatella sulfidifaciens]|uniref:DEAD/DEAH box helicase n=1 Tax=Globicatella sulfidifaciens TaxID=136093 RepID=A0A7X8C3R3_9LACT|nr:DEAD/DEAH box helicase [Globicatella sulfidifaciens]NLJ18437.1 DEAD/DEAH box helicase [Globicatella sulfidifaciens]
MRLQTIRDNMILEIEESENKTKKVQQIADDLFTVGLTMYSRNYSFDSIFYNSFAKSLLDENISLHPEQLNVINELKYNEGVIFSAPTSFGKTFVVFEYIAREKPKNVVLIVPTLALVDEYNKRIIKKYQSVFSDYNVYLSLHEDDNYNFEQNNLFILTHDRAVENANYSKLKEIDLLVIDEVYKLKRNEYDDRVLILNLAYFHLVQIAKKHLLLAPFISGIQNVDILQKYPIFIKSDFSPVVNRVKTYEIIDERDRNKKVIDILERLPSDEKTMIYFPTVTQIYSFVKNYLSSVNDINIENDAIKEFIKWLKDEIHEEWYVVKAMEKGFLVHNGQLPLGIRIFQLDLYDNKQITFNRLLCTSTLLEGVNTSAKHIIISKPSRTGDENFDAFDFYNLVGRSGRMFEHYLGIAHYVKGPNDPVYSKEDAIKKIEFEVTESSEDINIQTDNIDQEKEYLDFLDKLGITHEDYKENIGAKFRFRTILKLYSNYQVKKKELISELDALFNNVKRGRIYLIRILYFIFEGKDNRLETNIINKLINRNRLKIKNIINETFTHSKTKNIDYIITTTLRLKSSYIEYDFYSKLLIVMFFMNCEKIETKFVEIVEKKVKSNIEFLYFTESKSKKILKDLGFYERDIEKIIKIIGDNFDDAFELKTLLIKNRKRLNNLTYLSKYIINSLS